MTASTTKYGFGTTVNWTYAAAIEHVTDALKDEGFGVLTTIDVRATLKEKLGVDTKNYVILGACNPQLANTALEKEHEIGLLLPCNVIVYEDDTSVHVSVLNPEAAMDLAGNDSVRPVAQEAKARLERVIQRLASESAR